jgi:hypothetical protein
VPWLGVLIQKDEDGREKEAHVEECLIVVKVG